MHIKEILNTTKPTLSFEFFPPRTIQASDMLFSTINSLIPLQPSYVSVTYGAGGSTRELTHNLVVKIQKETGLTVIAHLTCVNATQEELFAIIEKYHENGIRNIMALRGDPPIDQPEILSSHNGFHYATDLVAFIKKHFPDMGIGIAGHPEGHPQIKNRLKELDYLKQKCDAGADYICTQLFFDNRDFYDFCERCVLSGIHIPIVAGLMAITSFNSMNRMADLASRARFPAAFLRHLQRAKTNEQIENAGLHWTAEQVRDLLDKKVAGIHFYTLNKADHIKRVCESLGISSAKQLV